MTIVARENIFRHDLVFFRLILQKGMAWLLRSMLRRAGNWLPLSLDLNEKMIAWMKELRYILGLAMSILLLGCAEESPRAEVDRYPVQIGNRYGYINPAGEIAIEPCFYSVDWFSDNRAVVELEAGKRAVIDKQGKVIFQDTSGYLRGYFSNGLIRFDKKDSSSCFIDTLGVERFCLPDSIVDADASFSDERLRVRFPGRRFAFLDTNGEVVFDLKRGFPGRFSEGLVRVSFSGRTCYMNKKGRRQFCIRDRGYDFNWRSGLAMVINDKETYFIDKKGRQEIADLEYDAVAQFIEGYAKVERAGKKGFINLRGQEVVPPMYEEAAFFTGELAAVRRPGAGWIFINSRNEQVIEQAFDEITMPGFVGELAYVRKDSTWGYINKRGKFVWTLK